MSENIKKQEPEVTILLATFNGERYLADQIESIVSQTYTNWRLLISDDSSNDGTFEILKLYQKKYADKVRILDSPVSYGCARDNFFYLMNNADSGYIMLCDQDDVWLPSKIEITLNRMKQLEAAFGADCPILVFTDLEVVDEDLNLKASSFMRFSHLSGDRTSLNNLLIQNIATGCTIMVNKSLLGISQNYKDSKQILMHDWWLALVASALGKIEYINVPPIKYRQHEANAVGAKNTRSLRYMLRKAFGGKDITLSIKRTTRQATQFLASYRDELNADDLRLVEGYAGLYKRGKLGRICFMSRNRVLKYGTMRKIAQMIWG
jgi:glycosyltransferase involved in cell wall biosynthesis